METLEEANQIKDIETLIKALIKENDSLLEQKKKSERREKIEKLEELSKNDKLLFGELMFYAMGCIGKKECSNYAFVIIDTILRNKAKLNNISIDWKEQKNNTNNEKESKKKNNDRNP